MENGRKTQGKTRGGTRESLNRQISITQGLDRRTHKVAQDQHRDDDAMPLEENRLRASKHVAHYQQVLCRYHSRRVRARCLEEGDLVLRRV